MPAEEPVRNVTLMRGVVTEAVPFVGDIKFSDEGAPKMFVVYANGTAIISLNMATGRVTIADGVDVDDAARKFWDAVERLAPRR